MRTLLFIFSIFFFASTKILASNYQSTTGLYRQDSVVKLKGKVFSITSKAPLGQAVISIKNTKKGDISDSEGNFNISLTPGKYTIIVSSSGKLPRQLTTLLEQDTTINFYLEDNILELSEVRVNSSRETDNILSTSMGMEKISIKKIEKMPALLGEVDVIKSILTLPGVSSAGEASGGFNVRGGSIGQNLVLFDEATIFYTSHLFGFFSVFNQDIVDDVTLYKGGTPARYGGRVSSILKVDSKSSLVDEFSGSGGISLVSGRFSADIPIVKNKLGLTLAARSTYSDALLKSVNNSQISNSSASFFDINAKASFKISPSEIVTGTFYSGMDEFSFSKDTLYSYGNNAFTLKYNNILSENMDFSVSGIYSRYLSNTEGFSTTKGYDFNISTEVYSGNFLMNHDLGRHRFEYGINSSIYNINPGILTSTSTNSVIDNVSLDKENGVELATFFSDKFSYDKFSIELGVRYSHFFNLGPGIVYENPLKSGIEDSVYYEENEIIASFGGIEPRFSLNFVISEDQSLKVGFQRMRQYLHLLANSVAIVPTDIYKLASNYVKPQIVDQLSAGYFRNFSGGLFESSAEIYYKDMQNVIEYKDGAELFLNPRIESELLNAKGYSYGIELSLIKTRGDFSGQLNYTFSRSLVKDISNTEENRLNNGSYFPAFYDRPHNISAIVSYQLSKDISLNANFSYSTGRPITVPLSKYDLDVITVAEFSERNQFRTPDFHRLDLSLKIDTDRRKDTKWNGSWIFGIYNVYGRKNPFSVFFRDYSNAPPQLYKLAIIGIPFPSISYNFEF